ncbi:MAG: xylulokinase [bacterium]
MIEKKLVGVDIGTQGTKAAIFAEDGRCLAEAFRRSKLHQPSPGVAEEDPEFQLLSVCETVKECIEKSKVDPRSVAGIGIDGQMAGIIGIGRDGKNVTPYDSWLDTRCAPYIAEMEREAGDEILRKTGSIPSFNHGPKILWWMHERKEDFKSIYSFVQPGAYAAMRLCGLACTSAFIDKTYLHFSGFADNKNAIWDEDLCRRFDLDPEKLPRIVDPHDVIGEVTPSMAKRCGLHPRTPVVAGCGDTVASFLSCGATEEGICVDVAGTASVFATTTEEFKPDLENRVLACGHSATPKLWHPYAYINGGGMNLEWFRREIAHNISFDELNRLSDEVRPREDDPIFIPHLGGRVCPSQPLLRGAWVGLNWNHTIGHLYRALLEGVALEYGIYMGILLSLYKSLQPREARITGGGAKSAVWNKIKADVLGIPVVQIGRPEGAPLGSALLAGFGVGVFDDLKEAARRWIEVGDEVKPNADNFPYYRRRIARYEALMNAINDWSERKD